jgi:threonine/homoserine/homoserine lactone efflux protein
MEGDMMSIYSLAAFLLIYALAVATPGPGIAAIVARCVTGGIRGAPAFIAGFMIGDIVWLVIAAMGLATLARNAHVVFAIVKYLGAAYLLYIAYRLWSAPLAAVAADGDPERRSGGNLQTFLGGLSLTLGNPKVMVFFLAILPTFVNLAALTLAGLMEIVAVILLVQPLVLGSYAIAAARAQRFFRNPRALRMLNRSSGSIMAGAAVAIACR